MRAASSFLAFKMASAPALLVGLAHTQGSAGESGGSEPTGAVAKVALPAGKRHPPPRAAEETGIFYCGVAQ